MGDPVEDQRRAVAILHAGGVDLDAQHQAEGVGDQVPLAALDPLSGIVSDHFAGLCAGFHALAVDDRRSRALLTSFQFPGSAIERVVDVRPNPGGDPRPEVAVNGAPRREVPRQHPPLAPRLQQVEDSVDHPPQIGRSRPTTRPGCREQRPDQRPLPIRHVACTAPARAHIVAPGGRRPCHPILRRLLPETTVNQADGECSTSLSPFSDRL